MNDSVKAWREDVSIPTYQIGAPEKNPMFLEKRIYQGSSGVVYPHAVIEKIYDEKVDQIYKAIYIENEYLKIMILPELGGRIQMAFDKIKQRHFVYYNNVIKPALVGLTGPWISGGIEFNWPQHHRPSTFEPVDHTIIENADGSKTVWVNEVERMFRTKGMAGFTLYPGKAYLEITGKLYNRTPFPQTFLWWANPAVKVGDDYQSIFPPDVYAVFDHGKRDVSSFPIAKGKYYKVDYAPGTDISRYKNIPVPTSYMAIASKYDFIGGYEHDTQAGMLHVADHHVAPGKKQWTWGNGEFGKAWDKNLTDDDGPYIELMTGVFTDNQPDFSWIQPYEQKTFTQYFMPYQQVGAVKNATKDAVINMEVIGNSIEIKLYVTAKYDNLEVALSINDKKIWSENINSSPQDPYLKTITLNNEIDLTELHIAAINISTKKILVSYGLEEIIEKEMPLAAESAKRPSEIENNEQLYLTGLHLEQYRHATYVAADYYEEALRRDPNDARNNNALGLWFLRKGKFENAEKYFTKAVTALIRRNPNPCDGEPYYNLGWSLLLQEKEDDAFEAFYKCIWNGAWQHAGYLNLARIATGKGNNVQAFELIEHALNTNHSSHTARHIKTFLLRKLDKKQECFDLIEDSLKIDPFNFGCLFEKYLLLNEQGNEDKMKDVVKDLMDLSRNWVQNFIEYAFDYAHAGLYEEAIALLKLHLNNCDAVYPMVIYYLGWFSFKQGKASEALSYFKEASTLNPDFCFPNRLEDVTVLQTAIKTNTADAKANYYLGNFWYDKRQYEDAIGCWEKSVAIDDHFPTVHRNLSLAYYNKSNEPEKALSALEKAFKLDTSDARILMELDQLYKKLNRSPTERLAFLETNIKLVKSRGDLFLERITLYNQLEKYQLAKELLYIYKFHPWEGGEGKTINQFLIATLELAKIAINDGENEKGLSLLGETENYPENFGEGKLFGTQENDIYYLRGLAYDQSNNKELALQFYMQATKGISEPVQAIFYNDAQPDKIFYQGLAWIKLGEPEKAKHIFERLITFGKEHLNDKISIDYFAVSLPDLLVFDANLDDRNKAHCLYLIGLGYLGLGNGFLKKADACFDEVLALDKNHQGAFIHKNMVSHPIAI